MSKSRCHEISTVHIASPTVQHAALDRRREQFVRSRDSDVRTFPVARCVHARQLRLSCDCLPERESGKNLLGTAPQKRQHNTPRSTLSIATLVDFTLPLAAPNNMQLSYSIVLLAASCAGATYDTIGNVGPAAFLWPHERPSLADTDTISPCGSTRGVQTRTEFPMSALLRGSTERPS